MEQPNDDARIHSIEAKTRALDARVSRIETEGCAAWQQDREPKSWPRKLAEGLGLGLVFCAIYFVAG